MRNILIKKIKALPCNDQFCCIFYTHHQLDKHIYSYHEIQLQENDHLKLSNKFNKSYKTKFKQASKINHIRDCF